MPPRLHLEGQRFGKLTAIKDLGNISYAKRSAWLCECDCGNTTVVLGNSLKSGKTRSCSYSPR
jgi:hypothetical protein